MKRSAPSHDISNDPSWLDDLSMFDEEYLYAQMGFGDPAPPRHPISAVLSHWFLLVMTCTAAMIGIGIWLFLGLADLSQNFSDSTDKLSYLVGHKTLHVPKNYVRQVEVGANGTTELLELHAAWPDFSGFSQDRVTAFVGTLANKPVVRMALTARVDQFTPRQRLELVYSRFFTGPVKTGAEGLIFRQVDEKSPYQGESIYYQHSYGEDEVNPFVARCPANEPSGGIAVCLREIVLAGQIRVVYRFPESLLTDWEALDAGVYDLLDRLTAQF